MNSICHVTALTSGYDDVIEPEEGGENVTHVLFSDTPQHQRFSRWRWRPLPLFSLNNKRRTMFVKSNLPRLLPGFDVYVWTDARIQFTTPVREVVDKYLVEDLDLVTFRHPRNRSMKDELREIARNGVLPVSDLINFYKRLSPIERKWPIASENNVFIARNSLRFQDMCRHWHRRIEEAPPRDQLSFDLACADVGLVYEWFDRGVTDAESADFVSKGRHQRAIGASRRVDDDLKLVVRENRSVDNVAGEQATNSEVASPNISVVVPVHNAGDSLTSLLESLGESGFPGEVVLLENGSSDHAPKVCDLFGASHENGPVEVFKAGRPLGFAGACNKGASIAQGDLVVFLNSDTLVFGEWWKKVAGAMGAANLSVVGAVGNVAGDLSVGRSGNRLLIECGLDEKVIGKGFSDFCASWSTNVPVQPSRSTSGHAFCVDKSAFDSVGGFDEQAFPVGYGEEVDLFIRISRSAGLVAFLPSWFVYHLGGGTFTAEQTNVHKKAGRRVLAKRYGEGFIERLSNDLRNNPFRQTLSYDLDLYADVVHNELMRSTGEDPAARH